MGNWFRNQIACYGAAIAIILEQLDAAPKSTVVENPNPLVRVQPSGDESADWHPDELIRRDNGDAFVLVWSHSLTSGRDYHPAMSAN
ncbi:MAG: hypothetical protein EA415_05205 [Sphaerobacteraceae bacterium]|nr:MAG: hypothetical protein EA415_05205 [Sphaerobacteraceae bacterium]